MRCKQTRRLRNEDRFLGKGTESVKYVNHLTRNSLSALTVLFVLLLTTAIVAGQNGTATPAPDTFSGKYAGTTKSAGNPDRPLTLELKKDEAGKVTGRAISGETTVEISEGTFADGKLMLKFVGHDGVLNAKVDGEKITGEWREGTRIDTVELKKVVAPAADAATTAFSLTGDWDAVADANGQPFPFALVLKADGEKITGTSSSQLGESTITNGTWKDGRLSFQLESPNGTVTMSAVVLDGKLSGEFDYSGQLQGKWVAVKKK